MGRKVVAALIVLSLAAIVATPASAQSSDPTLHVEEWCHDPYWPAQIFYGVTISVTGLPPNATFGGQIDIYDDDGTRVGGYGPTTDLTADESGNWGVSLGDETPGETWVLTLRYGGQEWVKTVKHPCEDASQPGVHAAVRHCSPTHAAGYHAGHIRSSVRCRNAHRVVRRWLKFGLPPRGTGFATGADTWSCGRDPESRHHAFCTAERQLNGLVDFRLRRIR
jgi:hypothetical protein